MNFLYFPRGFLPACNFPGSIPRNFIQPRGVCGATGNWNHVGIGPIDDKNGKPMVESSLRSCYPLVNIQKTMENHNFQWVNPLEIVMSNSYVAMLNYQRVHVLTIFSCILNHTKPLKTCVVQGKWDWPWRGHFQNLTWFVVTLWGPYL